MSSLKATFTILENIDSTNNYAMAVIQEGKADHGAAFFTSNQSNGKGQRGKQWLSGIGENIAISIAIEPEKLRAKDPFLFSAAVAICCCNFLSQQTGELLQIKWPNDIYWCNSKVAGILIENVFRGNKWNKAVIGIGVNVNQTQFDPSLLNPVSLKQIANQEYELVSLASNLHEHILEDLDRLLAQAASQLMEMYNSLLYKKNQQVMLKQGDEMHDTVVRFVAENGNLVTDHSPEGFVFGEVEWIL